MRKQQTPSIIPPHSNGRGDLKSNSSKPLELTAPAPIVKNGPHIFHTSDFGVEIGGAPSFEDLPRTIGQIHEKATRKLCVGCYQHRALFSYRGRVRFDRDHNLCPRCYRSAIDRLKATLWGGEYACL